MALAVDGKKMNGELTVPMSKSIMHRYLLCAFLNGNYEIINVIKSQDLSDDVRATANCLTTIINGGDRLECGESGTTLRFILPLVAAKGYKCTVVASGSLAHRPYEELVEELNRHDASINVVAGEKLEFRVDGRLTGGEFRLPGNVSSQYISGIMLAGECIDDILSICIDGELESASYVEMTQAVINAYNSGVRDDILEGDWSAGSMWVVANDLLGGRLSIRGLSANSIQGDRKIIEILNDFAIEEVLADEYGSGEIVVDVADCPDLVPAIALRAVTSNLTTRIVKAGRLKLKESNRLDATKNILSSLGANILADEDSLTIKGSAGVKLSGSTEAIDTYGDHRMVMLAALASVVTETTVMVNDVEAVAKSYPAFFDDVRRLGGIVE